ncbi:MAG TPA: ribosome small subunit-dependent GTPase A [Selenomonadales bacterium]|nr:ribosome small subunit-dependent GTPase A [Selenomonadales bacterium]
MNLLQYGWNETFAAGLSGIGAGPEQVGRVIADFGEQMRIMTKEGEIVAGKAAKKLMSQPLFPAVGDWVVLLSEAGLDMPYVTAVLPRRTKFSRAAAGPEVREQVVAANVDTVFLVQSLNRDFNLRRLERYLIIGWESGALPVVVLTKADCCDDALEYIARVREVAPGVDVHAVSAATGEGMEELRRYLQPGATVALLGSSGVGKSTLVNTLCGREALATQAIRENDGRGRHTTTHRELVLLPEGGLILDTPGMRMLSMWEAATGISEVFGDIEQLIDACRFRDCGHSNEPGCAVREALGNGSLPVDRWQSWLKLQRELAHLEAKKDGRLRQENKRWGKEVAKIAKRFKR